MSVPAMSVFRGGGAGEWGLGTGGWGGGGWGMGDWGMGIGDWGLGIRDSAAEQLGLVDDIRPQTSGFFQFRSSLSAGDEETRGFGDRARHAAAGLLDQLGRTLARERG